MNQSGFDGIAFKLSAQADTITATFEAMRSSAARTEDVAVVVVHFAGAFLGEVFNQTTETVDGLDLEQGTEGRGATQALMNVAVVVTDKDHVGMKTTGGLEYPGGDFWSLVIHFCSSAKTSRLVPALSVR